MFKLLFLSYLLCNGLIVLQAEDPLCFYFTWIREITNKSITCSNTPKYDLNCASPLIVTVNGKPPDPKKLWKTYKNNPREITCPMERGMVCVKSIMYENRTAGLIGLIGYHCTRREIKEEIYESRDCVDIRTFIGQELKVCSCQSYEGMMPCNYAFSMLGTGESKWCAILMCLIITKTLYRIFLII